MEGLRIFGIILFTIIGIIAIVIIIIPLVILAINYWYVLTPIIVIIILFKKGISYVISKNTHVTRTQNNNWQAENIVTAGQQKIIHEIEDLLKIDTLDHDAFLIHYDTQLIDSTKRGNQLYEMYGIIPNRILKLLKYKDPSTQKTYLCFVPDNIMSADKGMAWKFYLTEKEYDGLQVEA